MQVGKNIRIDFNYNDVLSAITRDRTKYREFSYKKPDLSDVKSAERLMGNILTELQKQYDPKEENTLGVLFTPPVLKLFEHRCNQRMSLTEIEATSYLLWRIPPPNNNFKEVSVILYKNLISTDDWMGTR